MFNVRVSDRLADAAAGEFGPKRSGGGQPSEWDFWSGPLAAALIAFRDFESLEFDQVPIVRRYTYVDPVFGPLVFIGVLIDPSTVELDAFGYDPDYWDLVNDDPID